jgi:hypothetical protein
MFAYHRASRPAETELLAKRFLRPALHKLSSQTDIICAARIRARKIGSISNSWMARMRDLLRAKVRDSRKAAKAS